MTPVMPSAQQEPRRRNRGVALVGACLCLGSLAAWPCAAWVAPGSRRAVAAGMATALLGAAAGAPEQVRAQETIPGKVSEPGQNEDLQINRFKDPPEVIAQRWEARQAGKTKREDLKNEFRGYFAAFGADEATLDERIAQLDNMAKIIKSERMLPIGITKDDLYKGVKAVKFNLGCVRTKVKEGDCKTLEKAINKLFATLDKTNDLTVVAVR
uniref:Uncharacterized protein n=1 Tax=Alexandrium andersonii TaxID=327968 RepID=A0A7S2MS35_9DINO